MVNSYKNIVKIKVLAEAFTKFPHKIVFVGDKTTTQLRIGT